jgi:hypothetical protein
MSPFIVEQLEGWTKQRVWEPYSRRWIVQVLRKPEHTCSESPAMQKYHEGISKWLKEL